MSKKTKRMYKVGKMQINISFRDGREHISLVVVWLPTKHNRRGTEYKMQYVFVTIEAAEKFAEILREA